MDYKDYQSGHTISNFRLRAKKELIEVLLSKCCQKGKELKILNLGVGTGDYLEALNRYGRVYVIDINKDVLKLIPANLCFEKRIADATKLPYLSNFFDVVISFDVFEHISDDAAAVSETRRVLKKNGHLLFSVPAFQFLFSSHDMALEHKRRYNKRMLKRLLGNFHNLKLNYWTSILFLPVAFMRIMNKKSKPKVENVKLPKLVNSIFYMFLKIENNLIKLDFPLPIGINIVGICKK